MTNIIETTAKPSGTKRRKARDIVHRLTLFMAVAAPFVFLCAAVGSRLGLWSWQFGLSSLSLGVGVKLLMAALCLGVLSLAASIFIKPRKGWWIGVLAVLIGFAGLGKGASTQKTVQKLPFIHDITTDTQNPPVFSEVILAERAKVSGVNSLAYAGKKDSRDNKLVSALQSKAYPQVRSLVLEASPEATFGSALAAAKSMGWAIKAENVSGGTIEATDTTFWYGFQDDISIRIRPSEGGGSIVDMRSVSRVGASDIGANAKRIETFLNTLSQ